MPDFPTYYGPPLPKALNLLNPTHYWLVFKWVFFQPTRLKYYLYQIDTELYRARGLRSLLEALRLPAYRNLYLIALITSFLVTVVAAYAASTMQATTLNWARFLLAWALCWAIGGAFGWTVSVTGSVALGVTGTMALGVAASVALGMAGGATVDAAEGATLDVAVGLAACVAVGVTVSTTFGVMGGVALGVVWGVAASVTLGVVGGMTGVVMLGVAGGVARGVAFGVALGVAGVIGASRLLFYPFELLSIGLLRLTAHRPSSWLKYHPALWDEFAIWPLPDFGSWVRQQVDGSFETALQAAVVVVANPFQRWIVQRALSDWLASQADPLMALQRLAHVASLAAYLAPPADPNEFRDFSAVRVVLFGEIGQQPTDGRKIYLGSRTERIAWSLTRPLRRMQPTPLSRFSAMVYELLRNEVKIEKQSLTDLKLAQRFHSAYEGVRIYPHGDEVANSWASLAAFLEVTSLEQIGAMYEQLAWILHIEQPYLSPAVIDTLKAVGDVSRSVAACLQATSLLNKTVALNQAAGGLQELAAYVEKELWPPERTLYLALVKNWQSLVAAEQGRLGESALRQMSPSERLATGLVDRTSDVWLRPAKPLANPYIAGDPVMPPLFVGRRDIFTSINETWRAKANPDSIILYGHRRMGKSSILRNLDQAAPGHGPSRVIACVNLQGETSFVASTADLLLALADRIYAEVKRARPEAALTQPPADQFTTPASAQIQFNRFMEQVRGALGDSGLILALDEFEAIEEAVRDGKVGKEIYQFLRAKTQEPWITVVFGGLHTLDEMSRDYAQPFYGSYQNIVVSYLAPEDAYHLITNPTPDFTVNYEPAAVERIIAATGGQPYLVQLVCRDALDHLNHELFDEHKEREVKLTLADVEAVLGDDLFRRGTGYFDGVWTQVSESPQQDLLRGMAQRDTPWTLVELQEATHHSPENLRQHLQLAQRRDILRQRDDVWEFCVPLMRRWINWKRQ